MNGIQVYKNEQFGEVRIIEEDSKMLFCGSDVAKALGYANPRKALQDHCRCVTKRDAWVQTGIKSDGTPAMRLNSTNFIPEGDVYRLITHSKLPSAERFERWVFDEILPSIRKHGAYMTPAKIEEVLLNPDTIISLATQLKAEREKSQALLVENATMKPKAEFADQVAKSDGLLTMASFAKVIQDEHINMGRNKLLEWLRNEGYLRSNNEPYQQYVNQGLFKVREMLCNGYLRTQTFVTGKGQLYLVDKLKKAM